MAFLLIIRCERGSGFQRCVVPETDVRRGEACIVHTKRGQLFGRLVKEPIVFEDTEKVKESCKFLRRATPEDINQNRENRKLEERAHQVCNQKIQARKLPMKLVQVEYTFDRSRATFYFTADGRIDFRELVKDLAYEFRVRIEMKQIGVRDEAKLLGGCGCCGLPLCCASFLEGFEPVSIRMAKVQNLTLDPGKISGVCGRLMCCLGYEYPTYEEQRKRLPRVGEKVELNGETGKIKSLNILRETARVEFPDGRMIEVKACELLRKKETARTEAN
jgi:cell fate regulator YaaT (PSP1 superfamily)